MEDIYNVTQIKNRKIGYGKRDILTVVVTKNREKRSGKQYILQGPLNINKHINPI